MHKVKLGSSQSDFAPKTKIYGKAEAEANSKGKDAGRKHHSHLKPGIWPIVFGGKLEKDHHYVYYNTNGNIVAVDIENNQVVQKGTGKLQDSDIL